MEKFYITTSIPYVNAPPHIGTALEFIQADVLARYQRKLGKDVFFLTGTDEHGAKIQKAAQAAGKPVQEFLDEVSQKFKDLKQALNLSNDGFIRTTDEIRHWPTIKKIWEKFLENKDLYKKEYKGLYCSGCEAFYLEKDLISGLCPIHKTKPEPVQEENYFFKLSKYSDKIKKAIEKGEIKIIPSSKKNEILNFIGEGLQDVSFSRAKERYWGFKTPGDSSQSVYVWADALPNYISGIGYTDNPKQFKKYWPADVHCIGKDILKFHAAIWPGMLMSLGLPLPKAIFVHGFINVGGQKMSKSLGNVIDPFELVEKYGADAVRYYLLREIPSTDDGDFTIEHFEERYNGDLASGLGNLTARVVTLAGKSKTSASAKASADKQNPKPKKISNAQMKNALKKAQENCEKTLEDFRFSESLKAIWEFIGFCDRYVDQEKPWQESKNREEVIGNLLLALKEIADLLQPFLPETSQKIAEQLESGKSIPIFPRIQ